MVQKTTKRVWFVTGASSGLGKLLAEEVLRRDECVIATARDITRITGLVTQYPETARAMRLDVTSKEEIAKVAQQGLSVFGQVDVLVNNAGFGVNGAIEEVSEEEFGPMLQTNLYGLVRVTRAFLPHFRERRSGHVINLSSILGLIGSAGWGFYSASKFAVEGFSEALAEEMKPLGVKVTVIEPGPFRTDFLGRSATLAKRQLPEYETTAGSAREYADKMNGKQPGDPQKAVEAIIAVVDTDAPPVHLLLGKIALKRLRTRLALWTQELNTWETVTTGADYPEAVQ